MNVIGAITVADHLVPNSFNVVIKRQWLADFDHKVYNTIISQYHGCPEVDFEAYSDNTVLLIDEPYADIYISLIESMIYRYLGEMNRYNNAAADVNNKLKEFRNHYNRTHEYMGVKFRCFTPNESEQSLPPELRS